MTKPTKPIERRIAPYATGGQATIQYRERADGGYTLTGYAATFNSRSEDLGGFVEVIRPMAFANALVSSDVRALVNHDPNLLLGRTTSGTLRLHEDGHGLRYELDVPDNNAGRDLIESVRRGDLTQNSFSFSVKRDEWTPSGNVAERAILEVDRLYDISPVVYPAYKTSVITSLSGSDRDVKIANLIKRDADAIRMDKVLRDAEAYQARLAQRYGPLKGKGVAR